MSKEREHETDLLRECERVVRGKEQVNERVVPPDSNRWDILTLFPEFFSSPLKVGLLGKALEASRAAVCLHNIRDWASDKHKRVDDLPFGGGPGMVLKPEPLAAAIEAVTALDKEKPRRILLAPQGQSLRQETCRRLLEEKRLLVVCGRYEGVDQRVIEHFIDEVVSIGDYVIMGGEAAALVLIEAVVRLKEGVLGNAASPAVESFSEGLLEAPQYTRPEEFRGWRVPEVLLSGDHKKIEEWRRCEAERITRQIRPDLPVKKRG